MKPLREMMVLRMSARSEWAQETNRSRDAASQGHVPDLALHWIDSLLGSRKYDTGGC